MTIRAGSLPCGRATVAGAVAIMSVVATAGAEALTVPELLCQQSIGKEVLRFVTRVHVASHRCEDATASGQSCDTTGRDAAIATALSQLREKLRGRCRDITLEHLGFPASCSDADGPPFDSDDLGDCVDASHRGHIATALAHEYPGSSSPLGSAELRCQRTVGNAGGVLLARWMRARQSCLNDQLSGRIAADVDCRADPPPDGTGSGAIKTDRRLTTAADRIATVVSRDCAGLTLEDLGFPGACPDPDGAPFAVADLRACIFDGHTALAEQMIDVQYPGTR